LPSLALALAVLRLSLVRPSEAQGFPVGWRAAWRAMRGNTWRLLAVMLIVYLPIFLTVGFAFGIVFHDAHLDVEQAGAYPTLSPVLLIGVIDIVVQFVLVAL